MKQLKNCFEEEEDLGVSLIRDCRGGKQSFRISYKIGSIGLDKEADWPVIASSMRTGQ